MPSRPFSFSPKPSPPSFSTKTSVLFLALTISASVVIFCSILYFLYHIWNSLVHRAKTIPFDASAPLKLQRFSYKDLKQATNGFDISNVIGKGGSGTVFRGILKDGKLIAIKRLDSLSLQSEREFQNELQTLGGLRSPFLVTLLGYSVSLQESLFGEGCVSLSWERRFCIILDIARALEFLHLGCDPPVIHGDIKPSNVLLDAECRGKISDFGLSRIKVEGEFGMDLFSQDLGKSQDLSGNLTAETQTPPVIGTPVESVNEVDFALALQASSSSKNSRTCFNVRALNLNSMNYNANIIASESEIRSVNSNNAKGKEISTLDIGGDDCWNSKFVPYDDEFSSIDYSKELSPNASLVDDEKENGKQWGKDWWWRQDGSGRRFYISKRKKNFGGEKDLENECDQNGGGEFSFRRGWRKKKSTHSVGSDIDLFSHELSSTTSMRGTLCYVAPEYGGCGFLMEKADIYSFGVLILVIVSGRRPLHVLASPMKLEKANLISWSRHLAHVGNILELVDERLKYDYNKEQASMCINLALTCLQKIPELRPDIGVIVKI
ncbi:putative protein kinase RLK-Pelle-RLCK-XI family [Lupinus albus]|uniref:non-specific serine/threonine protein kinase n=1 Tax=Lupinus albus TaxID=3870 RepID=A0A6A4N0Y7_LUPAL|nr:putative protein kinase RLK-Pelle-RLCK-XI family [Lupinus albus]